MANRQKIWAQLPPQPKDSMAQILRLYESAKLEGVWTSQTFGAPFTTLGAAAAMSDTLKLGTGIALAFARSPVETACNAMDLDLISGGRLVLGLGSSAKSLIADAFGMPYGKPLAQMREVVSIIRQLVEKGHTGELKRINGEYYNLNLETFRTITPPLRTNIPIYLPAVFENACIQAGEIADGLLSHPLWAEKWIRDKVNVNLKTGLDKAGRSRTDLDVNMMMFVAINEDKRQAIEDARPNIAFYSQSPQYLRYFEYIGFGKEAAAIQEAFARQDFAAMNAACSDEMVEAISLVGSPDEVRKRVQARSEFADSLTPVIPQFGLEPDKQAYYRGRLAEMFYG